MPKNWEARERKQNKAKRGMRVDGRSAFVIREAQEKRDRKFVEKTRDKQRRKKDD